MKTTVARCAQEIRKVLKKEFPGTVFSVTSRNYSMGNAVDISWDNGPTYKQVEFFINKFEYGTFDGMTDSYNYDNVREDLPQAKYIHTSRTITDDIFKKSFGFAKGWISNFDNVSELDVYHSNVQGTARQHLCRTLNKIDLRKELTCDVFRNAYLTN